MKKDSTRLINLEQVELLSARTINPPIFKGSTVLFDSYESLRQANAGQYDGTTYGTDGLPTQKIFEKALADIEGGYQSRTFPSGISAIINTLFAFLKSGDHMLMCDNIYGPTRRFCQKIFPKFNIETEFIPGNSGREIEKRFRPNTTVVFLESPGSNTFEIQDIPAITEIARKKKAVTILDNSWATPLYLSPFSLGVDLSIQSVSKYISGHSDILLGAVTSNKRVFDRFIEFYEVSEIFASPDDCYRAVKGTRTLPLRLERHRQSALDIAHWLEERPCVEKVIHPALPSHNEHRIWKRDFTGSTGLFAFTLKRKYSEKQLAAFLDSLELFGLGYSWGGFKSLITAGTYDRSTPSNYKDQTIIRLNIGLEDPEDLKADLENALGALGSHLD